MFQKRRNLEKISKKGVVKIIITSIFCLIFYGAQAHEPGMFFGVSGSYDSYGYSFVSQEPFDHTYSQRTSYSAGLNFGYDLNEMFSLRSGVLYSKKDYELDFEFRVITPGDPNIPDLWTYKNSYLEIPLQVDYRFVRKEKINVGASLGWITSFLVKDKRITISDAGTGSTYVNENTDLNKTLMALSASVSFEYVFNETVSVLMEPYSRWWMQPFDTVSMNENPTSTGISIGLLIRL